MSCHAPACVGCVRFSRTEKPPKQHIVWLLSVALLNRSLRTSSVAADRHGMPSARDCPMDAARWASRHRKSRGDFAQVESLSGVRDSGKRTGWMTV
ncbi:hypothetical protein EVAR_67766_1 [Eumeta japonica]|uniref:Uncharacterized protein n=1 Tax=Eumeta variegata TaxID=151549 RepID=A0A4C2A5U4_EUMVA|nr:hypothetical protein EVAR_67766_1 [Eumeta japonica]